MGKYTETHTIILRILLQDCRIGVRKYRYLRIVEIDSPKRRFQEKYQYVVEESLRVLFFFRKWKVLSVHRYFNFTEAREHLQFMLENSIGITPETRNNLIVLSIDLNPHLDWK